MINHWDLSKFTFGDSNATNNVEWDLSKFYEIDSEDNCKYEKKLDYNIYSFITVFNADNSPLW